MHGNRLGLWQFFLHDVAEGALARGNAVSASNPEAILQPHPSTHYNVLDSALNRMGDAKWLFLNKMPPSTMSAMSRSESKAL